MKRSTAVLLAVLLGTGLLTACTSSPKPSAQNVAARTFLADIAKGDLEGAAALTSAPATAATALRADVAGLGTGARASLQVTETRTDGKDVTSTFTASWTLPGASAPWTYTGTFALTEVTKTWLVTWTPSAVFPGLTAGLALAVHRVYPERAALDTSDGKPIFTETPVVHVGIEPSLVKNLPSLARTLAGVPQLQSSAAQITSAVQAAASPTDFVPVITLRQPVYEQIRAKIHDLDGTVFQSGTELLPPSANFAEPLLGTVGPATAQLIQNSRGRLAAGDQTGIGGLQQALDAQLSGSPAVTVVATNPDGSTAKTLATITPAKPGSPVVLTINRVTQQAAESALSGITQAATIVAVQRSTGRILADANSPAATYDLGLAGAFPAGSTFKIATWTAAFTTTPSLGPASTVTCPSSTTVDGRKFVNENGFSYPPIPISSAFGYSCNTSAINEAMSLPAGAVRTAAIALGLGATWSLPVASFSGSLPLPASQTEQAADAIGQGRVQVSPLLMALMAGAATSGVPQRPSLIAGTATTPGTALPAALVAKMNALMRATVTLQHGTGHVLDDLPGVAGKTGTAEYGTANPPRTHTWFAGVQGDVAFAVFVYDGATVGIKAATIANAFLRGIQ